MSLQLTLEAVSLSVGTTLTIDAPGNAQVGVAFTVSGELTRDLDGAGLSGLTVSIYGDGTLLDSMSTGSGGAYAFLVTIDTAGNHTVQTRFAGATWDCTGCEGTCQIGCELACQTACEGACQLTCQQSCQQSCQLDCKTTCQLSCQGCEGACETGCEVSCQTACEYACKTGCEVYCQTGCQVACQTACELQSCQLYCQKSCQQSCQLDPK